MPGFFQGAIENFSGGPDKRFPGEVFLIARLLTDQHERRVPGPFAKNCLRPEFV